MHNLIKRKPKRNKIFKAYHYADNNAFAASALNGEKIKVYVTADKFKVDTRGN